jgi:lipopolysaccharide/colanic/teichoic acid biosynthesis glycosyltransferase
LFKRLFDVLVSLNALVLLSPLMVVVSLAIVFGSPGGVLFYQERVGRGGRPFAMLKFRSMVPDAEALGSYQTNEGDPRITPIGKILRQTSLDELPQLVNVLKGDMSLVGPRPDVPAQRDLYTEEEWFTRCRVRPGITGLAQATLRSAATQEQRKALDLQYVARSSLLFDFWVLLLTARQLLTKGGY